MQCCNDVWYVSSDADASSIDGQPCKEESSPGTIADIFGAVFERLAAESEAAILCYGSCSRGSGGAAMLVPAVKGGIGRIILQSIRVQPSEAGTQRCANQNGSKARRLLHKDPNRR